jgi:glycosyltransferase involved in cell wall biosynthesis
MMKIAVNTRLLRKNKMDGIGWFTYNTLQYIVKQNPAIEFHFFFDSGVEQEFLFGKNVVPHNLFPPAKHAILNIAWSEISVKRQLKKIKPDLYFSPDGMLCLGWNGKQHGVIHDLNFVHNPMDLKYSNRKYYNYFFPKFAKKAAGLATVSAYSKADIQRTYGIDDSKIDVVYCGINSFYSPIAISAINEVRNKYTDGDPYFLFVGTISPRKNILGLMKAFELYKSETGFRTKLIIAGGGMYKTEEFREYQQASPFSKDMIFTGRLSDQELNKVLASALALVFVPFFEGFGIPLIEAMKCDVPIIASNVTSLPEVVDNAALLVDPHSELEIKEAMKRMSIEDSLRVELIQKGRLRREYFSWEKTSNLLWNSISKCL